LKYITTDLIEINVCKKRRKQYAGNMGERLKAGDWTNLPHRLTHLKERNHIVTRPGCEADYSPPPSAEVKKRGAVHHLLLYISVARCLLVLMKRNLVKHREHFTFTLNQNGFSINMPWRCGLDWSGSG